ncbi:MAG: heparinase II/III family protein [Clostridia bacterium]|nr:heparinase II/III family protein [Clostridia bacterium]
MKKLLFCLTLLVVCMLSATAFAAADDIIINADFEQYSLGSVRPSEFSFEHSNLTIEEIGSNKVLKMAHSVDTKASDDSMLTFSQMNFSKETMFTFDIANRNSKTGSVYVQLRASNGSGPNTSTNLINLVQITSEKITYLPSYPVKVTETLADGTFAKIMVIVNPVTGSIKVYNNNILKTSVDSIYTIPNFSLSEFDFSKVTLRFQNYVVATPDTVSQPYVTDIIYDNIRIIHTDKDLVSSKPNFYYNNTSENVTEVKAGPINGRVSVVNKGTTPKDIVVFMTHKSDGLLKSLDFKEYTLSAGEITYIPCNLVIEETFPDDCIEMMVLEQGTLTPVLSPKLMYIKNSIETPIKSEMEYLYNQNNAPHPRVMATAEDFAALRQLVKTDATAAAWAAKIKERADDMIYYGVTSSSSPYYLRYVLSSTNDILTMSRRVLDLCETLGLAHQLTGLESSEYSEFACTVMRRAALFQDWNPSHFLDTGEMMAALAIGYDWMYTGLDDDTKQFIEENIYNKGLVVAKAAYDGTGGSGSTGWWKRVNYNWNTVCNGGIAITAAAFADVYPELAFELSSIGINNIKVALEPFAPHGGYDESATYAIYSLEYLARLQRTLKATYGTDFGIMNHVGLSGAGDYLIHVDGPTGTNNYHDSGSSHIDTAILMWLADEYNAPRFATARMINLERYGFKVEPLDLLWYNPDISADDYADIPLDAYFAGAEFLSMRSGFGDNNALFLSAHGGEANVSHSHIDGGTFVLDMFGERFAGDVGSEGYGKDGYFGDRRFEYYRARAEGHNTIVINPDESAGQSTDCHLPFDRVDFTGDNPFGILNMTPAYAPYGAESAKRGYMLCDNRNTAVIRDEVEFDNQNENTVYWFMHTTADVSVSGNTIILTKNGKSIKAEFSTDALTSELSYGKAEPLPESNSTVENAANNTYKRVYFKTTAKGSLNITVKFTPVSGDYSDITAVADLAQW